MRAFAVGLVVLAAVFVPLTTPAAAGAPAGVQPAVAFEPGERVQIVDPAHPYFGMTAVVVDEFQPPWSPDTIVYLELDGSGDFTKAWDFQLAPVP